MSNEMTAATEKSPEGFFRDRNAMEADSLAGASADSPSSGTVMSSTQKDDSRKADHADVVIAAEENRNVFRLRLIVLFFLLLSTVGVAVGVHRYISNEEQASFEQRFEDDSQKVLDTIGTTLANTLASTDAFLVALTSFARSRATNSSSSWPFVSLPEYAVRLAKLRSLSKAVLVSQYHYVTGDQRAEWEQYSVANDAWVQDGIDTQKTDETYKGKIVTDYWTRGDIHNNADPYTVPGPYLPKWQQSPVIPIYAPYNWDAMTFPSLVKALPIVQDEGKIAIGDVSNIANMSDPESVRQEAGNNHFMKDYVSDDEDETEPFSDIYFPILDFHPDFVTIPKNMSISDLGNFVGVLGISFYWRSLLPKDSSGIVVVIENSCGKSFTYRVNGPDTHYLGRDDRHERKYDDYLTRDIDLVELDALSASERTYTGLDLSEMGCQYHLSLYPSTDMENEIKSNNPLIFTIVAVCIFVFTSLIFIVYDYMVERRQAKVMQSAVHSNAIVSSLFPATVRERLFKTDTSTKNGTSSEPTQGLEHNKTRLKTFLSSDGSRSGSPFQSSLDTILDRQPPIADLFPECTVSFCDIRGFTAWSSVREPSQVFQLLETLYSVFDLIAMRRGVFKVETIGDAYVAVTGLPEPRADHAIVATKFARDCLVRSAEVVQGLEKSLGPGTGELRLRFGLHSGPVTAGVLRGEKSRFQLFGDTVNTAARMESTGIANQIQVSEATRFNFIQAGKQDWLEPREELVKAKGKGMMQTYWVDIGKMAGAKSALTGDQSSQLAPASKLDEKTRRLVDWNHDILSRMLKQVIAVREGADGNKGSNRVHDNNLSTPNNENGSIFDEVREIIDLPDYDANAYLRQSKSDFADLDDSVSRQLREYVVTIAGCYQANHFHNFDHASHVGMSTAKLLSRIVSPEEVLVATGASMPADEIVIGRSLHQHTFGLTSDPLAQFACVFSALIHDADHPGVPNATLVKEQSPLAAKYQNKSVAEQHSVAVALELLMSDSYQALREAICPTPEELQRFRHLLVTIVLATDIMDKDLIQLRNDRWDKAFSVVDDGSSERKQLNRKATIVLEHLIQASDVAHTMQHWHIYQKWNERLFNEMCAAYKAGRAANNPAEFWYEGELSFLDNYVLPLAKKLRNCGVFGVSSDEYLNYALKNREEWELRGKDVVATMIEKQKKS